MNKKNYLWWAVGLVVLILAVYVLASLTTPATENNSAAPEDTTVQPNNAAANPFGNTPATETPASAVKTPTPTPSPVPTPDNRTPKAITPEFMTVKEKEALKINPNTKVQILQKLPDGTIGAYKVINSDSDILTSF